MVQLPFERAEYLDRIAKTKRQMEEAGIDVLLVSDDANSNWLSGYDGQSSYVPQFLFVAGDEEEPLWVGREQDGGCARNSVFMDESRIVTYDEHYIGHPGADAYEFMASFIQEKGWAGKRLGVELDAGPLTHNGYMSLQRRLPAAAFVDAGIMVNRLRGIKSPQELEYMRQAGVISDLAMRKAIEVIREGVRQCDAAAEIAAVLVRGTDEFGSDGTVGLPTMPTGRRTSAPHLTWTDARYQPGEATNLELGGSRFRYQTGLSRTVVVGKPEERLAREVPVVAEAMTQTLDQARAGQTCEEFEAVFRTLTTAHGVLKPSRIGYAIGNGWTEGWASLAPGDTTVFAPNMTFHLMLGFWYEDWGFVLSETFRITDDGPPETFATLPRQLFVNA